MSFLDKEKTFTDMQFVSLMEPGVAVRKARTVTQFSTNTMQEYNMAYWQWKKDYRHAYSPKYLKRSGFDPATASVRHVASKSKLLAYMQTKNSDINTIISNQRIIPEVDNVGRFYLQEHGYDWINSTNTLVHGGITYTNYRAYYPREEACNNPNTPLICNAPKQVCFGDTGEWIIDPLPGCDGIVLEDGSCFGGSEECRFTTTAEKNLWMKQVLILEFTNVNNDKYEIEVTNAFLNTMSMNVIYTLGTDNVENGYWYVYIEDMATIPNDIYEEKEMLLTAIIAIKEDDEFVEETLKMKRILNKFGIGGDQLIDSLTTTEDGKKSPVDNAYIIEGISTIDPYELELGTWIEQDYLTKKECENKYPYPAPEEDVFDGLGAALTEVSRAECEEEPVENSGREVTLEVAQEIYDENRKDSSALAKALYKSFEYITAGSGNVSFDIAELKMNYSYDSFTTIVPEMADRTSIGKINKNIKIGEYASYIVTHDEYDEMMLEECKNGGDCSRYINDGYGDTSWDSNINLPPRLTGYSDAVLTIYYREEEHKYIKMTITNYLQKFEISGHDFNIFLDDNSEVGRFILPLEVINDLRFKEFVIVHENSFCMLAYAIETVTIKWYQRLLGVLISLVLCMTGAGCTVAGFIVNMIYGMIIGMVINMIADMIDSEILSMVFRFVVSIVQLLMGSGVDLANITVENFLKLGVQVANAASSAYQTEVTMRLEAEKIKQKEEDEEMSEQDKVDRLLNPLHENPITPKMMMDAHYSFTEANSPDAYYAQMLGGGLFNFDQYYAVTDSLDLRVQVKSG